MFHLKAAIIGAGSTYTPELIEGLLERQESLPFDSIALMDIDAQRLAVVGGFAQRQLRAGGYKGEIILTGQLERAVEGASFVFGQVRVGQMAARIRDERIPLKYGLLGQETTGIGGFMNALRTVPVIMDVADRMKSYAASDAWLINFSNPSGIVAQAVLNNSAVPMVGLCNCPINMLRDVTEALGTQDYDYEYLGLNHLSWITSVTRHGERQNLVAQLAGGGGTRMQNIPEVDLPATLLSAVPYIPSYYLSYFYLRDEQLRHCIQSQKTRGEVCLEMESGLFAKFADPTVTVKPSEIALRGGALYSTAAVRAVESIYGDKGEYHVVAAKNNGAVPFMEDDDVVEVKCRLYKNLVEPQPVRVYNDCLAGLMRSVKAYEKLTVKAALSGSYSDALAALLVHPLIGDFERAKGALDEMLQANRDYLPRFFV